MVKSRMKELAPSGKPIFKASVWVDDIEKGILFAETIVHGAEEFVAWVQSWMGKHPNTEQVNK